MSFLIKVLILNIDTNCNNVSKIHAYKRLWLSKVGMATKIFPYLCADFPSVDFLRS